MGTGALRRGAHLRRQGDIVNLHMIVYAFTAGCWIAPIIGLILYIRHEWKEWELWNR